MTFLPSSPADDAVASTAGTLGSFLNPASIIAGVLGPALAGAPSSASGAADSGSPVTFGNIAFDNGVSSGGAQVSDATSQTQVPVQPTVGYSPQTPVPFFGTQGPVSGPQAGGFQVSPIALGGAGLAALAAFLLI